MEEKKRLKKVVIVNKNGPFDRDITGKSLLELGTYLQNHSCDVAYICVKEAPKSNGPKVTKMKGAKVFYMPRFNFGNQPILRLLGSLVECKLLFWKALFIKSDAVIVMTSPPLLNFFGVLLKKLTKRTVIFWTMDLYPEAFVANGLVKPTNRIYKWLEKFIYNNPPDALIVLGNKQRDFLLGKYQQHIPCFLLPCGIQRVKQDEGRPEWLYEKNSRKISFCYAGNLGEAHDENFIIAFAKALDPARHHLYINLYGAKAAAVLPEVENLSVVQKVPYLSYGQMQYLDVHLASLLTPWDHVCVPSKAVSAICAGAVLLLNTSQFSDGWNMFNDASFWIEQNEKRYGDTIASALKEITEEAIGEKKLKMGQVRKELYEIKRKAFKDIITFVCKEDCEIPAEMT